MLLMKIGRNTEGKMRKAGRSIICALLVLCVMAALVTVQAFAWDAISGSGQGTVGEYLSICVDMPNGEDIDEFYLNSGTVPPGMAVSADQNRIVAAGTPTGAGTYAFVVDIRTNSTDYRASMTVTVKEKQTRTVSGSVKATYGKELKETELCDVGEMIQTCTVVSGKLPEGIKLVQYDTYFAVSGTPTEAGSFTELLSCETEGDPCTVSITVTVEVPALKITKSPGSETVKEGENAVFVSAAENYSDVEWRIVSKDGSNCWRHSKEFNEIEKRFPDVKVDTFKGDDGREWMRLSNIPFSMDGYYIETKYRSVDKAGTAFTESKACLLTVEKTELKTPVISVNPVSAEKKLGEALTLSVQASDPNGGTLSYQWFSNSVNSNAGGNAITGATGTSLNVPQTEGTVYYYVNVVSRKDDKTSAAASSSAAAVSYTAAAPDATTAPSETPAPSDKPEAAPEPSPEADVTAEKKSSPIPAILAVIFVLLIVGAVLLVVLGVKDKKAKQAKAAKEAAGRWKCPACGAVNKGAFCSGCGKARPRNLR